MYQALYRKYRPQTLEEVGGQDTIVKIIKNSIENNKINHAYLFAGPRGTGKTSIAKIFAKMVNCENLQNGLPCGKCTNCTQINNSDTIEIDAASNNGVNEIRELRNNVNLVPSYGKYKIYIIDELHMLTTEAFNALLKTLEEPPAHIIFILATTDPHKIPETILSRCQRLDFKKISEKSIVNRLKKIVEEEQIQIEEDALKEIARLSDGGMRDSIGMLDQAIAYSDQKITTNDIHDINGTLTAENLKNLISVIITREIKEIFEILDKYNDNGKNFVKLTEEIITFMRNILLYKNAKEYFETISNNNDIYEEISKEVTTKQILEYIEILNSTILEMKKTNNTKLLLEIAIIKMINSDSKKNYQIVNNDLNKVVEKTVEVKVEPQIETTKPIIQEEKIESKEEIPKEKEVKQEKELPNHQKQPITMQKISDEGKKELLKIKNIRIDNTLAKFSKKHLQEILSKMKNFHEYLLDSDISPFISIILDGNLKAASENNLIFIYKNKRTSNLFNENIINVEKTIEKVLKRPYKVIATDVDHWEIIKNEFNNKKREYNYIEETFNIEDLFSETQVGDFSDFQDIIEYK